MFIRTMRIEASTWSVEHAGNTPRDKVSKVGDAGGRSKADPFHAARCRRRLNHRLQFAACRSNWFARKKALPAKPWLPDASLSGKVVRNDFDPLPQLLQGMRRSKCQVADGPCAVGHRQLPAFGIERLGDELVRARILSPWRSTRIVEREN